MPTFEQQIMEMIEGLATQDRVPDLNARKLACDKLREAIFWVEQMYKEVNPS